jgi:hypothetical protein
MFMFLQTAAKNDGYILCTEGTLHNYNQERDKTKYQQDCFFIT